MDYEEWELIPGDGFLKFGGDEEEQTKWRCGSSKSTVLDMNYFECPLPSSRIKVLPIQLEEQTEGKVVKEEPQQHQQSQVFFIKKIAKEQQPEFVDMIKMESLTSSPTRGFAPVLRGAEAKDGDCEEIDVSAENGEDLDGNGVYNHNLWRLSLTGLVFSFATICVLFLGNHHGGSTSHRRNHEKITFNIYNHDHHKYYYWQKRGRKINDAMSGARAQVTFSGFHEAL